MLDQAACWHAHLSAVAAVAWHPHAVDNRRQTNDRITDEADARRVAIRGSRHRTGPRPQRVVVYPFRFPDRIPTSIRHCDEWRCTARTFGTSRPAAVIAQMLRHQARQASPANDTKTANNTVAGVKGARVRPRHRIPRSPSVAVNSSP